MSRCEVTFHFKDGRREWRSGETLEGHVEVRVLKDMTCNEVNLNVRWRTHGRGNSDAGVYHRVTPFRDTTWEAGESFTVPFSCEVPSYPLTYRGVNLNVDHEVRLHLDVPWALDPRFDEDFVVLPGRRTEASEQAASRLFREASPASASMIGCMTPFILVFTVIGLGMILFGGFDAAFGGVFFTGISLFMLFMLWRKRLAMMRVGEVRVELEPRPANPGDTVTARVIITPPKAVALNNIRGSFEIKEVCVSGSGTNKTTYTHTIHPEESFVIEGQTTLAAGEERIFEHDIALPDIQAYSFEASDNDVRWSLSLRLDIPTWPDWIHTEAIPVEPRFEEGGAVSAVAPAPETTRRPEPAAPRPAGEPSPQPAPEPEPLLEVEPEPAPEPEAAPEVEVVTESDPALVALLVKLEGLDSFSSDADAILEAHGEEALRVSLEVTSTERSFSMDAPSGGMTVRGEVAGVEVRVMCPESMNAEVEGLSSGTRWVVEARPVKWDSLFSRLEMLGEPG